MTLNINPLWNKIYEGSQIYDTTSTGPLETIIIPVDAGTVSVNVLDGSWKSL